MDKLWEARWETLIHAQADFPFAYAWHAPSTRDLTVTRAEKLPAHSSYKANALRGIFVGKGG